FPMTRGANETARSAPAASTAYTYSRAATGRSFITCPRRISDVRELWQREPDPCHDPPACRPVSTSQGDAARRRGRRCAGPGSAASPIDAAFTAAAGARFRFGFELVLENLAVQRAATDVQDAGRFLLVPLRPLEHPDDMRAFGFGERRQPVARW